MQLTRIISGAQTGADRGGLDAAIALGVPYGGYVPKGRKAEDGRVPDRYANLIETTSGDYLKRTRINVEVSTATVIFTYGPLSGGSLRTKQFCDELHKHCLHIDLKTVETPPQRFAAWLVFVGEFTDGGAVVLNVAGQRESKAPGIQEAVKAYLVEAMGEIMPDGPSTAPAAPLGGNGGINHAGGN